MECDRWVENLPECGVVATEKVVVIEKKKMKQTNRKGNLHYQTRAHRQMNSTDHYFRNLGNRRHSVLYNLEINDVRGEKPLYEQMIRPLSLLPPLSILT